MTPNQQAPRKRWSTAEKRRMVELTLLEGSSVSAIAHEHGVCRNSLYQWQALYRTGKLGADPAAQSRVASSSGRFLPVTLASAAAAPLAKGGGDLRGLNVVQITLCSGATLRIETGGLDTQMILALVMQLQR